MIAVTAYNFSLTQNSLYIKTVWKWKQDATYTIIPKITRTDRAIVNINCKLDRARRQNYLRILSISLSLCTMLPLWRVSQLWGVWKCSSKRDSSYGSCFSRKNLRSMHGLHSTLLPPVNSKSDGTDTSLHRE